MAQWPLVTVIMPIRNEERYIKRSLGAVLAQNYPAGRLEVLVVDGLSEDGTREIVTEMIAQHQRARILDNPGRIRATALNVGLAAAEGEIIMAVDGHAVIAPGYVLCCVEEWQKTGADWVGGPMRAVGETPFGEAVALAISHPFGIGNSSFHYATEPQEADSTYLGAWPRTVFDRTGTFDEEMIRNQDDVFSYRLRSSGGRVWLTPRVRSTYYVRSTLRSLWRQYFQYGYWKVRVFQKVPGSARLRHWIPPLFVLAVVGGLPAALLLPMLRLPYLIGLALYALANLAVSGSIAAREGWRHLLRLPVAFASLHLAYGLGYWAGLFHFGPPWRRMHAGD